MSTNIADFPEEGPRCSCRTTHAPSRGRTFDGKYRSQRLAQYPGGMCDWIAQKLVATFVRWHRTGEGPTGWRLGATPTRHVTSWSSRARNRLGHGVAFLNEATALSKRTLVNDRNSAFYLHVDDGLFPAREPYQADAIMNYSADALQTVGFSVTDRTVSKKIKKDYRLRTYYCSSRPTVS